LLLPAFLFTSPSKKNEPLLLFPIGFGIVLANFPLTEIGPNVVGVIGSAVAAVVFLTLIR
jgi:Na+-transporting methylmalonyl-CoA/oxaloacetate decarboxylase beta subunit